MYKDLLPIGSVVLLKDGVKKLMIIGLKPMSSDEPDKVYDYMGVLYPEGFMGEKVGNYLFDHSDINDVVFKGYSNPEREAFIKLLDRQEQK